MSNPKPRDLSSRRRASLASLLVALALTLATPASLIAQSDDLELGRRAATAEGAEAAPADQLKISLGAGVASAPEFEGAKKYEIKFLPVVELGYDRLFLSLSQGLGARIIDNGRWVVAPSVRYRAGRDEDDSDILKGMGDVDDGLAAGVMVKFSPSDFSLFFNGYQGLGSAEGLTMELGAAYKIQVMEHLKFSAELSTMFADEEYNQEFFGVNSQQAGRTGYDRYQPDSGFKHVALGGALSYSLTQNLNLGLFGEYKVLTGPAADSPLVERGSKNQFSSGLMLGFNLR